MKQPAKYASPHLELPDEVEWLAYDAIRSVLQNDPAFNRVTNTYVHWDGSVDDVRDPHYSYCPYCRLGPYPSESNWITELQHLAPIALRITLAVKGTRVRELLNYWACIRKAIFPQNQPAQRDQVMAKLQATGIWKPTLILQAYGLSDEDAEGARMLIADGTIRFALPVPT